MKMHRNYFFWIVGISIVCLFLIFYSLAQEISGPTTKEKVTTVPLSPFKSTITGVGVVEASSENVFIGSPVNRIVDKITVKVGSKVKKGDELIQLEDRDLKANLLGQQVALKSAEARFMRLQAFPRPEELAAASANLKSSQAELNMAKNQYEMVLALSDPRAISQEERNRRLYNFQQADAKAEQAKADFEKTKAGTWQPDLEIAHLEIQEAQANIDRISSELQRTTIKSPIEGTVLQIKVHEGEYTPMDSARNPMMIIGNVDEIFLRVSINQFDIPLFNTNAKAVAYPQGDAHIQLPLEFVYVEPYLVEKLNLTNEITEKVDTRVLQIVYRIKRNGHRIFVGQQMDVFIEDKTRQS